MQCSSGTHLTRTYRGCALLLLPSVQVTAGFLLPAVVHVIGESQEWEEYTCTHGGAARRRSSRGGGVERVYGVVLRALEGCAGAPRPLLLAVLGMLLGAVWLGVSQAF